MRQIRTKLGLVIVCMATLFTAATLTACGDDDDPDPTTDNDYTATATYTYQVSEDVLEVADITATYTNADGETVTEAVTATKWTATVTKTCPADFPTCTVTATVKEGLTIDNTRRYVLNCSRSRGLYVTNGTTSRNEPGISTSETHTIEAENVTEERITNDVNSLSYTFRAFSVNAEGYETE